MKVTMERLGVTSPFRRPRVSNRNAFSEALFRASIYVPAWPAKGFASIEEARAWVMEFVSWYNTQHHHSAIRFVIPELRRRGEERCTPRQSSRRLSGRARQTPGALGASLTAYLFQYGADWLNSERPDTRREGHGRARTPGSAISFCLLGLSVDSGFGYIFAGNL